MRIFATSDLHTDFLARWNWLESLSAYDYRDDALIIAGDIAHKIERVEVTLPYSYRSGSTRVFCSGNHELWVHGELGDSLANSDGLLLCAKKWVSIPACAFAANSRSYRHFSGTAFAFTPMTEATPLA